MISLLLVLAGLFALVVASDIAVSASKGLARDLGVSPLAIGVTLAAIGTSLPEIATNLAVAFESVDGRNASGVAVGNIVGSCLSQITLLVGVTALVGQLKVDRRSLLRDGAMAFVAIGLMLVTCVDGVTERWEAALLVLAYAAYLRVVWRGETDRGGKGAEGGRGRAWRDGARAFVAVLAVAVGADVMVRHGVELATGFGVPQEKLGLAVGVATGLPELVLAVKGMRAGMPGLAIGNLIGSNITDPLLSYGLGAAVHPVAVASDVVRIDFPLWAAATALTIAFLATNAGVTRVRGVELVIVFAVYAVVRGMG